MSLAEGFVGQSFDEEVTAFARRHLTSFTKLEVLRLLQQAPAVGLQDLARELAADAAAVQGEMRGLLRNGLVERGQAGGHTLYSLTTDPARRTLALEVLRRYKEDGHFRVMLVLDILKAATVDQNR